ncbi:F-box only protein 4-like isoform X1 [Brachionichthys hirsutus]|uniref:F-box only protein 4-like isoform X1 n=1 Tax=Brachionichthys hirsutus TaxID=412623 RepID=UPI003604B49A
MAGETQQLKMSVVVCGLQQFREKYFRKVVNDDSKPLDVREELGFLDGLPVEVQFLILTFLSPADIFCLGATSHYWRALVRDPLLWKYFLLRDMPYWPSINHVTMPKLDAPLINEDERADDRKEGADKGTDSKCDYMTEYLKGFPSCRQQWVPSQSAYEVVSSLFQSLVASAKPRYAMFGPGLEQLEVSLVGRLVHARDILPMADDQHRQTNGIGSGISYMFNNKHQFNILTLYTTNRAERERGRFLQQWSAKNRLFTFEGTDDSGYPIYSPAPQVQQVCQVADGFIYVANAEPGRGEGESEVAQIRAVLSVANGSKPLLVLSCISHEEPEAADPASLQIITHKKRARSRTPCVDIAKRLGLPHLVNPWMVQDTVALSLSGLLDGLSWLLRTSGVRLSGSR